MSYLTGSNRAAIQIDCTVAGPRANVQISKAAHAHNDAAGAGNVERACAEFSHIETGAVGIYLHQSAAGEIIDASAAAIAADGNPIGPDQCPTRLIHGTVSAAADPGVAAAGDDCAARQRDVADSAAVLSHQESVAARE